MEHRFQARLQVPTGDLLGDGYPRPLGCPTVACHRLPLEHRFAAPAEPAQCRCQRIGPALLFERLWHEVGCRAVLEELAAGRQFEFAAERAVFFCLTSHIRIG